MTNKSKERLHWLDSLKGYMILTVVFLHCYNGYNYGIATSHIIKYITSFHMVIFFMISGYIYEYKKPNMQLELKKKIKKLIIPYLIYGVIIGFLIENTRVLIRMHDANISDIIFKIMTFRESYLSAWFLFALFGVYVIEIFIAKIFNIEKKYTYFIIGIIHIALLIGGFILSKYEIGKYFQISIIMISSFFFFVGHISRKIKISNRIISLVAIIAGLIICFLNGKVMYSKLEFGNFLIFIISAVLSSIGYIFLFKLSKNNENKLASVIRILGENSIVVMLTHAIIIYLIRALEVILKMKIHTFPGLLSFAIVSIIEVLFIKYMPSIIKKTFGKKIKE